MAGTVEHVWLDELHGLLFWWRRPRVGCRLHLR
jgi:hypothetical protein